MTEPRPPTYAALGNSIFADIVAPDVRAEVADLTAWRRRWRKGANVLEAFALALSALSGVFAFAAGFFDIRVLSFVAGALVSASTALTAYSKYANHESSERTVALNRWLTQLGLDSEPDLVVEDDPPEQKPSSGPRPPPGKPPSLAERGAATAADKTGEDALLEALGSSPVATRAAPPGDASAP